MNETFQSVSTFGLSLPASFSRFKSSMRYAALLFLAFAILVSFKTVAQDTNNSAVTGSIPPPLTADELEQRGKHLRDELTQTIKEWKPPDSFARLSVTSIVLKYIPVGSSFKDAAVILDAAGVNVRPLPPRPPRPEDPGYDRFNLSGGFKVLNFMSNRECAFQIVPEKPGDPDTTVKQVSVGVFQNFI